MAAPAIGMIGTGVMGGALALNMASKGFGVALWNREPERLAHLLAEAGDLAPRLLPCDSLPALVAATAAPRVLVMMVPAGPAVDEILAVIGPLLSPGDVVIDGGNADFHDTNRRAAAAEGFHFLGLGVSGGEEGARHGPALMAGGAPEAWALAAPVLTAIAARAPDGAPCAAHFGPGGAGHFVKMAHNGIEYADMQMIAEVYGVMRDGLGMGAAEIGAVFGRWNAGPLQSYLIEVTAAVALAEDPHGGGPMLDAIVDAAGQKGTGRWTVIEALKAGTPVPVMEAAVGARTLSAQRAARAAGAALYGAPARRLAGEGWLEALEAALIAGKIMAYAQGFEMLRGAGAAEGWALDLAAAARVWRAGCIIRSAMLEDMAAALAEDPARSLILAPGFADRIRAALPGLRRVVAAGAANGLSLPALGQGLAWFDAMCTLRGTANLLQAQRDFFGRHGFERRDGRPEPHGPWV